MELSEAFGLQILDDWKTFEGSVELLTAALEVVVTTFVFAVLLSNIDDSALALAKLNPIELGDFEVGANVDAGDDETVATETEGAGDGDTIDA